MAAEPRHFEKSSGMEQIRNWIDGQACAAASDRWLDVFEPATGQMVAQIPDSDASDVQRAVDAAQREFNGWSGRAVAERSRVLMRLADLIERDVDTLAQMESRDTGKPLSLARRVDIPRAAMNFRFFASAITQQGSESYDMDGEALNYTRRSPRGVAGLISPWNLPLYLLSWKVAPALATGNTVVAKPSEVTPCTASKLAELALEAGVPAGVLNIVHGRGPEVGAAIVSHTDIPTISFTGSTATGEWIAKEAAPMFKRFSLELGGKNANVIFADADIPRAVEHAVSAAFTNQGQICLCGSRVLVEESVHDEFVELFLERVGRLRVGDPMDEVDLGSLVSKEHLTNVSQRVDVARDEGAEVLAGGCRAEAPNKRCAGGYFYEPTVLAGLGAECRTEQEEIFGPVVSISTFHDEQEALDRANSTRYGLAAMVWTSDLSRGHRVAAGLHTGIVWVNCWMVRDLRTPFGGMKQSGVGREGGTDALRFFTEPKNICIGLTP
jgi:aminomuconate-semialdehyde/2-hydroxymuconate-6-semialdehyde dehydrogenase